MPVINWQADIHGVEKGGGKAPGSILARALKMQFPQGVSMGLWSNFKQVLITSTACLYVR
jgi:hypothetical protein